MKQPLLVYTILIIAGTFLGMTANTFTIAIAVAAVLIIGAVVIKQHRALHLLLILLAILLPASKAGYAEINRVKILESFAYQPLQIEGVITDLNNDTNRTNLVIKTKKINGQNFNIKLNTTVYGEAGGYEIMDKVTVDGGLSGYADSRYWGDYSYKNAAMAKGIYGTITNPSVKVTAHNSNPFSPTAIGFHIRTYIERNIDRHLDGDTAAMLKALVVGDKSDFSDRLYDDMSLSGISHITSTSGLHVSIFISIFGALILMLSPKSKWYWCSTIFLVFLFIVAIGARPSILRAGGMTLYSMLLISRKQRPDSLCALMFTSAALMIFNPYYAVDVGFQLSFLATLGIIIFSKPLMTKLAAEPGEHKNKAIGLDTLAATLGANILTLPLLAYHFNNFTVATVIGNIIVIPIIGIIMISGYITGLLGIFSFVSGALCNFLILIIKFLASLKFMQFSIASPSAVVIIGFYAIVAMLYFKSNKKLFRIFASCACAAAATAMVVFCLNYNKPMAQYIPEAAFIRTKEHSYVLIGDGYEISNYAIKKNIRKIDLAVLTDYNRSNGESYGKLLDENKIKVLALPEDSELSDSAAQVHQALLSKADGVKIMYYKSNETVLTVDGTRISLPSGSIIEGEN